MKIRNTLLIFLPVFLSVLVSCKDVQVKTYEIKKGSFRQTIVETGELAAIDTRSFVMPRYGRYWYEMKIIGLLDHGTVVKAGDSIIQLDPTEVKKTIIELQDDLETEEANLKKLLVNQSNTLSEMETNLKNEQASFNLKKLEMEYSRFESERIRKIKELEFNQAKISFDNVQRNMKLNRIIASNDLKIQKIKVRQLKEDIKSAEEVIPKLTIRTPIPGIFQIGRNRRNNNMLKIGDEIYSGNNLGNVPDLTWMKVITTVNEADFFKLSLGQKVIVRLDAIPDVTFSGEVNSIGKLCHLKDEKSRQKVFDVEVRLLKSDKRLKPGMTVSSEFICRKLKNVLYVPLNCIESTETGNYIYLKKGGGFERTEVETGPVNNTHMVIVGDFKDGQLIAPVSQVEQKEKE
jgi:HlyD family secretion protein